MLATWIATKVTVRKNTMNTNNYLAFVKSIITRINALKSNTTNQKKLAVINYLAYELTSIVTQIEDDSLFLDDIDI